MSNNAKLNFVIGTHKTTIIGINNGFVKKQAPLPYV